MASSWQEAAVQQAEEVSARLRQLLTTGLGLLRTEYGLDLGLQPQHYPSWVFLAVPIALGLVLLLLICAAGRGSASKKRPKEEPEPVVIQTKASVVTKSVKSEDPKKKNNKKKPTEKAKPNGRPVELAEEQVVIPTVKKTLKQPPSDAEKKNEKAKKNKKKPKPDAKQTQLSSQDKKEAEEGNWETKISNREKRQQRKRDKGTDSELTIPGVETTVSVTTEQIIPVPSHAGGFRKNKGSSEIPSVNGSGWNEKPTKLASAQLGEEKWVSTASTGKKKAESCTWNQDTSDTNGKDWSAPWSERPIFPSISAWSAVDGRMNAPEQRQSSFSTIGLNSSVPASVTEPVSQPNAPENQWDKAPIEPPVDDEWSGLNGLSSTDPSSDWNAPAEEWGNWGEEEPVPAPQPEEPEQEPPKVSDDEKEETAVQGSVVSKTKKKKKKKKKQEESGSPTQDAENAERETVDEFREDITPAPPQPDRVVPAVVVKTSDPKEPEEETRQHTVFTEPSVSVIQSISEKSPPQVQQPQETSTSITKQNSVPPSSQAKSEESWESPKQVKKKKKARRET
ncbi:protein LYRIC [Rhinophrynus dorsalis]